MHCTAELSRAASEPDLTNYSKGCLAGNFQRTYILMLLFHLPFKFNASWCRQTLQIPQCFSPPVRSPLVASISGKGIGAVSGSGGISLYLAPASPPPPPPGFWGQGAHRGSLLSCNPRLVALCESCYQFQWLWFVVSICTITRNLIGLCTSQWI